MNFRHATGIDFVEPADAPRRNETKAVLEDEGRALHHGS